MHNKHLFHLIFLGLFLFSCAAQKDKKELGTLKGQIGKYEGNCMPGPGVAPCKPTPMKTTVYFTKPSNNFKMELLIDSIVTNDEGEFQINLIPSKYSLFVRDNTEVMCTGYECEKECYCTPFQIVIDSVTNISANINKASW